MLYVNYTVENSSVEDKTKLFQAGPYDPVEAEEHLRDIASYVGVRDCYLSPYRDERRTLISSSDLVKRIREIIRWVNEGGDPPSWLDTESDAPFFPMLGQAADEIEQLHKQFANSRRALEAAQAALSDGALTGPLVDDALNKIALVLRDPTLLDSQRE